MVDQLNNEITKLKQKLEQSEIRLQQFQVCRNNSDINFIFISFKLVD
jgi:hypothetical protein